MRRKQPAMTAPSPAEHAVSAKALTVLQAARNVFLSHGFSAATTDMIQQEAGVSKSTVYAHYPNKEALFVAVIETECAVFAQTMRAIEFRPGQLPQTLSALARAYLNVVLSPVGLALFRVVIAEAPRFPSLARTLYLAGPQAIAEMVAGHLAQAADAGEIDLAEIGSNAAADLFISLVRSEPQLYCLTHPSEAPAAARINRWTALAVATFMRAYGREARRAASERDPGARADRSRR